MTSTWCPFAKLVTGAPSKWNDGPRLGKGAVLHSAEGFWDGMWRRLADNVIRRPDNRVSWHFSVLYDGTLIQHYALEKKCWHAHAVGNENYIGIEHEGVAGEPETPEQVGTDIRLLAWLAETEGWPGFFRGGTLWEHNEVPGNPTACPSHRILWDKIIAGLQPPAPVTIDGIGVVLDDGTDLGNILPSLGEGRTVAGVGAHLTSGEVQGLWPK